ncbi:uncharacterized protein [Musca autumnalis]|uniref:uncharacterized protein n=1 Tax=Musca autumnalis TaxID=221902 RepID=UPI003CEFF075
MSLNRNYRRKLMEYRRSVRETTSVASMELSSSQHNENPFPTFDLHSDSNGSLSSKDTSDTLTVLARITSKYKSGSTTAKTAPLKSYGDSLASKTESLSIKDSLNSESREQTSSGYLKSRTTAYDDLMGPNNESRNLKGSSYNELKSLRNETYSPAAKSSAYSESMTSKPTKSYFSCDLPMVSFSLDSKNSTRHESKGILSPNALEARTTSEFRKGLLLAEDDLPSRGKSRSPSSSPQPIKQPEDAGDKSILYEPVGKYINWRNDHTILASMPWCCIGDLMAFCDKYEFKALSSTASRTHANIVSEVRALLSGKAPFGENKRFPSHIRNPENLMLCLGRSPSIEYHLGRIQSSFRKPLETLSADKQRIARQNFHLAIRELRLDISARLTGLRLYDQKVFERDFHLTWVDNAE